MYGIPYNCKCGVEMYALGYEDHEHEKHASKTSFQCKNKRTSMFLQMFNSYEWIPYMPGSIWSETNEKWSEGSVAWRVVGMTPNKFSSDDLAEDDIRRTSFMSMELASVFPKKWYFIIEFPSGRLEISHYAQAVDVNSHVILEADRGEDCGKVVNVMDEYRFESHLMKIKDVRKELALIKVVRRASGDDVQKLEQKKEMEATSLRQCREMVSSRRLDMDILSCEYQWDAKKITFYFRSDKRIDFRDLLKDLFKIFKVRIWMCAERRSSTELIKRITG